MNARKDKSFLKATVVYGLGGILLPVSGVILLPLYTRLLSPSDFGFLELVSRTGGLIMILLMVNGVRMAALTFYQQAETDRERNGVYLTLTLFTVGLLLAFAGIIYAFSRQLAAVAGVTDATLFAFGLIAVMCECLLTVPMAILRARIQAELFVMASLGAVVVRVGLIVLFLSTFDLGLLGVFAATALSAVLVATILFVKELLTVPVGLHLGLWSDALKFALPFIPGGVLGLLLMSSDRFFLSHLSSSESLGVYALAAKIGSLAGVIGAGPMFNVWTSIMYDAAKHADASFTFGSMYHRILTAYLIVGLIVSLFVDEILLIFGTHEYFSAAELVPVLVLAEYFILLANLGDSAFYICRKTYYKPLITLFGAVIMLILLSGLVPAFGAWGAAWASVVSSSAYAGMTLFVAQGLLPISIPWYRVCGLLISASLLYCVRIPLPNNAMAVGLKICAVTLWLSFVWKTGLISPQDREALRILCRRTLDKLKFAFPR